MLSVLLGAVAVSALRIEGLVESGCVAEKEFFLCLLLEGKKSITQVVETHRLCPVGHNVAKQLSVEQIFL